MRNYTAEAAAKLLQQPSQTAAQNLALIQKQQREYYDQMARDMGIERKYLPAA